MMRRCTIALGVCLLLLSGASCRSERPAKSAPAAPAAEQPFESDAAGRGQGYEQSPAESPESSYGPNAPTSVHPATEPKADVDRLFEDLTVAESIILAKGYACADACRALRSMERSAARLCAIAQSDREVDRCRDAEERVRDAKRRVRTACVSCPGGPPLDDVP
jgi:hypothetical protein